MDGHDDIPLEIDLRKIEAYLLSVDHPEGAGKAAYFARLGYTATSPERFAHDLRRHFAAGVVLTLDSDHGRKFVVRGPIEGPSRTGAVVSVWLRPTGANVIRLVTAYPGDRR